MRERDLLECCDRDELWLSSLALLCELSCLDTSLFLECGLARWVSGYNYSIYTV